MNAAPVPAAGLHYPFPAVYQAAMALLPPAMTSPGAWAMLWAIGMQESLFRHRRQMQGGPARGFWQFEMMGGTHGVLHHRSTRLIVLPILGRLCYPDDVGELHAALEHNDVLACIFARLLLWTLPVALPKRGATRQSWVQYISAWHPGKPHAETWPVYYARAWELAE